MHTPSGTQGEVASSGAKSKGSFASALLLALEKFKSTDTLDGDSLGKGADLLVFRTLLLQPAWLLSQWLSLWPTDLQRGSRCIF